MKVTVINAFREREHNFHYYEEGDVYPAKGYALSPERVQFLAEKHPTYNKVFVKIEEEKPKKIRNTKKVVAEAGE